MAKYNIEDEYGTGDEDFGLGTADFEDNDVNSMGFVMIKGKKIPLETLSPELLQGIVDGTKSHSPEVDAIVKPKRSWEKEFDTTGITEAMESYDDAPPSDDFSWESPEKEGGATGVRMLVEKPMVDDEFSRKAAKGDRPLSFKSEPLTEGNRAEKTEAALKKFSSKLVGKGAMSPEERKAATEKALKKYPVAGEKVTKVVKEVFPAKPSKKLIKK